ncbi:MAG: HlyC/CorC family transporter [Flavobacteriales bacterium TMED191]|nr:MAG: HlyC/CorC family transporter [Flavobacteriales bacterium TMED191]|tara:strand:+ start:246 stop:1508 length:1263 start_codon:yes stop_codon:yes gene_type:complete
MVFDYSIIFLTLLFSAFFSGMEIAFVSSNKLKIFLEKEQGNLTNKIVSKFTEKPTHFIISMLIGNNVALVIYGIYMANLLEPMVAKYLVSIPFLVLLIQVIISSFLVLLVAEFLPKVVFSLFPNKLLKFFAIPAIIIIYLLYPLSIFINTISNFLISNIFGKLNSKEDVVFNRIDLDEYLEEHNEIAKQSIDGVDPEIEILQNALDFSTLKVRDCMIPRTEIIGVNINDSITNLRKKFIQTGHSKILVFKDNLDSIVAYVHSFELFKNPNFIKDILLPISIIPESLLAQTALDKLLKERRSVALVVDEYGGTSGLICVEDILEELVGEIEDEHDETSFSGLQISDNKYHVLGKHKIDDLNKQYDFKLELSEEYDTLSGFIVSNIGRIPKNQEIITIKNYEFKIVKITDNFIEEIILCVIE